MKKQTNSAQGFGVPAEDSVKVIIETPKGSRNKFKYDPDLRMFKLSKVLPEGMVFPYDFGFVPSTKGDDGDPVDVLVVLCKKSMSLKSLEERRHYPLHHDPA